MTIFCFLLSLLQKLQRYSNGLQRFCDLQVCNLYKFAPHALSLKEISLPIHFCYLGVHNFYVFDTNTDTSSLTLVILNKSRCHAHF